MEPVKYQRSEPSVRLLNEIDILLTQVQLAERYLKQAQTAAADEVARVHERYESELKNLRAAISQKERSSDASSARVAAIENLHRQIQDLEARLEEHRRLLENREQDLQRATAEVLSSRSQIAQLQLAKNEALTAARDAERVRQDLQTELGKLRDKIEQKTLELQQHRSAARESEQILQDQLRRLQDKLAQEQVRVSAKDGDLEQARAEFQARLQESRAQLEETERQLEQRRAAAAKVERDLQERLNAADEQLRRKQAFIDESESELQKTRASLAALQSRIAGLETDLAEAEAFKHETQRVQAALENEIAALRTELDNRDRLLAERQAEIDASRQNIVQLEASQRLAEEAANSRLETTRSSHEAELAQLRTTLAERDHAFAEREAELKNSIERHAAEIAELRSQLGDGQSSLEQRDGKLQEARSEIAALRERAEQLELLQKQTERLLAVQAEQIRQRVRAELEDLDARLASKDRELHAVRESAAEAQASHNATISGLRLQLAEKLQFAEGYNHEVGNLQEKTRGLLEQIAQLESSNQHLQGSAADAVERSREAHQAELAALREQLRLQNETLTEQQAKPNALAEQMIAQVEDLQNRLAEQQQLLESREDALTRAGEQFNSRLQEKDDTLQALQTHTAEFQDSLNSKLGELQTQLLEKQRHLENTTGEIADLKARVSGLFEQASQLASAARDAESTSNGEVERVRLEYQAELLNLQEDLRGKNYALAEQETRATELERRLGARITDLESELAARQRLLQEREEALNAANSSAMALQERLSRLEAASRDEQITAAKEIEHRRQTLETELAELRNELLRKDSALAQRQASIDNLAQEQKSRIQTLEAKLVELRRVAENRATELDRAVSEGQRLLRRVDQLEAAAANAEATAMSRVEQMTQRYETQMAALHIEIERKKTALEEHGAARNNVEQTHYAELSRVRAEAQEKHMLLESRNQEFAGMKNAMESLREQLTQLGTTAVQDQERLRAEYEAQLAALREELSQRESTLDERRTAFNVLEGRQSPVDNGNHKESAAREPEMTGSQMERSNKVQGAVETAQTKTGESFHPRGDRRWRSLGGWKRRWKT